MSVENRFEHRTDKERWEIAERREQFWKDRCRDAEKELDKVKSQHRDKIDKHNQALGMGLPSSRINDNQACRQTHSENLVLVGLNGKYCVHYQLAANYYHAYRNGEQIGGGRTLRMASETCKEWAEYDEGKDDEQR